MSTYDRDKLIASIKRNIFGPADINEEETLIDRPLSRYICGVLFPKEWNKKKEDPDEGDEEELAPEEGAVDYGNGEEEDESDSVIRLTEQQEDDLNQSSLLKQSAVTLLFSIKKGDQIDIELSFATYSSERGDFNKTKYIRHGHLFQKSLTYDEIWNQTGRGKSLDITVFKEVAADSKVTKASLRIFRRWRSGNNLILAVSLVNDSDDRDSCFFQTQLIVKNKNGFPIFPFRSQARKTDEEKRNELLYRDEVAYAVGKGCSPVWDDRKGVPTTIKADFMPEYELKAVVPISSKNLLLYDFYEDEEGTKTFATLSKFCDGYEEWIHKQEKIAESMPQYKDIIDKNLNSCRACLKRMRGGIQLLMEDENAFLAFRLMNEAMILQRIHNNLERAILKVSPGFPRKTAPLPRPAIFSAEDLKDSDEKSKYYWRSFQLGFILLSIESTIKDDSPDRQTVDLIWFPTGGGKTEAYLGLTAFTLIYNRLVGITTDETECSEVLMRYTLRLLTSQQFQRASALICSLEWMRATKYEDILRKKPFTIGLWVGGGSTPNVHVKQNGGGAIDHFDELSKSHGRIKSKFVMTKCPWCGAEMGTVNTNKTINGFKKNHSSTRVLMGCSNPSCHFHQGESDVSTLPLMVVDESIYEKPPSLLMGTVDKFATIPFTPKSRKIFGLGNGAVQGRSHPSLIIQDELHLINGPLGSTVAAYETMIDALCSYEPDGKHKKPKIVASTATISQAESQCRSFFNVKPEQVAVFPPQAISANETYFSEIDINSPGRKYVGIYCPAASTASTATIHFLGSYIFGREVTDWSIPSSEDAYWTNVLYFNSIRELSLAKTWQNADVKEVVDRLFDEAGIDFIYSPSDLELNSRNGTTDVGEMLQKLEIPHGEKGCIDFVYSTNMFSVGVDIQRLGIMTIIGQPKTTSEYIQASSRVGRKFENPGVVFVNYNPIKSRDKSVFESFEQFHSKFYSLVEPMSISPFCPQLREKVLPAVLVGISTLISPPECADDLFSQMSDGAYSEAEEWIRNRVRDLAPENLDSVNKKLAELDKRWRMPEGVVKPSSYNMDPSEKDSPVAIIPEKPEFDRPRAVEVPTSMRNVDSQSTIKLSNYE